MTPPKFAVCILTAAVMTAAHGHGGGLNAEGCHTNRRTGDYHCHRGGVSLPLQSQQVEQTRPKQRAERPVASGLPQSLPPGCFVGPRGGTYTITKSGRKNYSGC